MQDDGTETGANEPGVQERPAPVLAADEVEALKGMIADLQQENTAILAANKAIRAEIMAIRKDMTSMNEVIKNLLSIYEAVCRDFNPFRDDDPLTLVKVPPDGEESGDGKDKDL
jgi:Mg2+ and Co2+ transporter CorA